MVRALLSFHLTFIKEMAVSNLCMNVYGVILYNLVSFKTIWKHELTFFRKCMQLKFRVSGFLMCCFKEFLYSETFDFDDSYTPFHLLNCIHITGKLWDGRITGFNSLRLFMHQNSVGILSFLQETKPVQWLYFSSMWSAVAGSPG